MSHLRRGRIEAQGSTDDDDLHPRLTTPSFITPVTRTGRVIAFASGTAFEDAAGHDVQCVITDTPDSVVPDRGMLWEASGATANSTTGRGDAGVVSGSRSFNVVGDTFARFALMCRNTMSGTSQIWDPQITVLFIRN